jgi:hexosaminidase
MKKILFIPILFFAILNKISAQKISIIPEPLQIVEKKGTLILPKVIEISAPESGLNTVDFLKEKLTKATGYKVFVNSKGKPSVVALTLNKNEDTELGKEGYRLSVSNKSVIIKANTPAGLYYGAQSLVQLLPAAIEANILVKNTTWSIPTVEITDVPRFGWRGLMLDVSRHFFTKADVKSYIDQMARYKYNLLHWHLTDDEGWRIEIKTLPKLTSVGAWNSKREGYWGSFEPSGPDEPKANGGFYTQEDIKEIVAFAKARYVEIMPEVDVPGHSMASVVSYPELSLTEGADKYTVISGERFIDWSGPHMKLLKDNTLNPANEKIYPFLDKVFTEVAALFPFDYIHIGGDECGKDFWEKSPEIAALMKKEGLKDMNEVQAYFTKRVVKMISEKGKKAIGWDEILEGGLAPGAAVMSWRGEKGGIEAAKQGHEVVMTPTQYCYIDYMQGDSTLESKVYATLLLEKAYSFDPIPAGVDPKLIKGAQANLWTEQVYNMRYAQYMTWPRALATSEVAWSALNVKKWDKFVTKIEDHFKRFDQAETNYSPAIFDPTIKVTKDPTGQPITELIPQISNLNIHYSWDNSPPDNFYSIYTKPLSVPKGASQLKLITYRGKEKKGRLMVIPVANLTKRAK